MTFKRLGLIEAGWLSYAGDVVPKNAPPVQIQETRLAFWAGAAHMFSILGAVSEDRISEGQGVVVLERVAEELRRFGGNGRKPGARGRR